MITHFKKHGLLLLLGLLAVAVALTGCGNESQAASASPTDRGADVIQATTTQQPEIKTLYVGPELQDCTGVGPQKCMMVKESPDGEYQYFYQPIDGFDYEEGYEYEIVVKVEKVANPPADGSSLKYSLVKIVSKTPIKSMTEAAAAEDDLDNTAWELQTMRGEDGEMTPILDDAPITLTFAEGKAAGSAGCNNYFTGYQASDGSLSFDKTIGTTLMACPPPIMAQEQAYLALLPQTVSYQLDGETLTLRDADGNPLLAFKAQATATGPSVESEPSLVGPVWAWQRTEMSNGDVMIPTNSSDYTVQFMTDGSLVIKADCNQASGQYSDDNGSLHITVGAVTRAMCGPHSLSDTFLQDLAHAGTYVFDDEQHLVLNMQMDSGNMFFAPAQTEVSATGTAGAGAELAGDYKTLLPPDQPGDPVRVAALSLQDDGSALLEIRALGEEEATSYTGTWEATDGQITIELETPDGPQSATLTLGKQGDLQLAGKDLTLIKIDAAIPLHKQLSVPVDIEPKAYVTLDLQAGNPLDPFIVSVNGGGRLNASLLGGDCTGYVTAAPVARVRWQGQADFLRAFFYSDHDPVLIVQSPDGAFHCNDDANRLLLDPSITLDEPQEGSYNIWVGSHAPDQLLPGVLVLTIRPDVSVETFTLDGLIKRGPVANVNQKPNARPINILLGLIQHQKKGVKPLKADAKPLRMDITAKGDIPAFEFDIPNQQCNGFIAEKPDAVIDWSGDAEALRAYFEGDADSTLLVVAPGGKIFCNDDADTRNMNPLVTISRPEAGRYALFVGRVHNDQPVKGVLTITDDPEAGPAILAPAARIQSSQ